MGAKGIISHGTGEKWAEVHCTEVLMEPGGTATDPTAAPLAGSHAGSRADPAVAWATGLFGI